MTKDKAPARKYAWIKDTPDHRDRIFMAPMSLMTAIPTMVDLRSLCTPVENQGAIGSCTGNATAGAIEMLDNRDGTYSDISRLFLYYLGRKAINTIDEDSGAMIRDVVKAAAKVGAAPESVWPYNPDKFKQKPPKEAFAQAEAHRILEYRRVVGLMDVVRALAAGYPVVFGFTVYESFESLEVAQTGRMPMPDIDKERAMGGHAVLAVGYNYTERYLIVRNSWGAEWGDKGYFYMPFGVLEDKDMSDDFWVVMR